MIFRVQRGVAKQQSEFFTPLQHTSSSNPEVFCFLLVAEGRRIPGGRHWEALKSRTEGGAKKPRFRPINGVMCVRVCMCVCMCVCVCVYLLTSFFNLSFHGPNLLLFQTGRVGVESSKFLSLLPR